jgi:hypothetical protein
MAGDILMYVGGGIITAWGVTHISPTKGVVAGFGDISQDNRRIIAMEWVGEGLTLCFLGLLAVFVTALGGRETPVSLIVYRASAAMLFVMAAWTQLTGARTSILPIKICPFVKTAVGVMWLIGDTL